jgi:hypothetical protein
MHGLAYLGGVACEEKKSVYSCMYFNISVLHTPHFSGWFVFGFKKGPFNP